MISPCLRLFSHTVLLLCFGTGCANLETSSSEAPLVGGALDPNHPAVGQLTYRTADNRFFGCTATLISPRVVLTGAHCLDKGGSFVGVEFGSSTTDSTEFDVVEALPHPMWAGDGTNFDGFDIGMVLLDKDVLDVEPMRLHAEAPKLNQSITLVGWGRTSENDINSSGKKRLLNTSISFLRGSTTLEYGQAGATQCFGDSGGPALVAVSGREEILGVMSYNLAPVCASDSGATRVDVHRTAFVEPFVLSKDPATPPTVSFAAPADGATIAGTAFEVNVTAMDDTRVDEVELLVDGTAAGTLTAPPFRFTLTGVKTGPVVLTARATDNRGTEVEGSISITVTESGPEDGGLADAGPSADAGGVDAGGVDGGAGDGGSTDTDGGTAPAALGQDCSTAPGNNGWALYGFLAIALLSRQRRRFAG